MKFISGFLLAVAALVMPAFAQVPVGPNSIKIGKVLVSAPSTPEYQITGGQSKRYTIGKWLEFEVSYDTIPELIDELTFRFTASVADQALLAMESFQQDVIAKMRR